MKRNGTELLRPHYFERQQLRAADLMAGQEYIRKRRRRHNRYLHGWGVVCGAQVSRVNGSPWQVEIAEGYVVTPLGDEIYIPAGLSPFDVQEQARECLGIHERCDDLEGLERSNADNIIYLVVCPAETPVCPQPAVPFNCQPGGGVYEYSRICETAQFKVLCHLPASHSREQPSCEALQAMVCGWEHIPCPEIEDDENCVVLACLDVGITGINQIDDLSVRRQLLSESLLLSYLRCQCEQVAPPNAAFFADPTMGFAPLTVTFRDQSSGQISSWLWNFADGHTSTEQHPVHTYQSAGFYPAMLTVAGPGGSSSASHPIDVRGADPPHAAFSREPEMGAAPLTVNFTDLSSGIITSRLWNFGDGGTSAEQNPVHIYRSAGIFSPMLTVTGPGGSTSASHVVRVRSSLPECVDEIIQRGEITVAAYPRDSHWPFFTQGGESGFVVDLIRAAMSQLAEQDVEINWITGFDDAHWITRVEAGDAPELYIPGPTYLFGKPEWNNWVHNYFLDGLRYLINRDTWEEFGLNPDAVETNEQFLEFVIDEGLKIGMRQDEDVRKPFLQAAEEAGIETDRVEEILVNIGFSDPRESLENSEILAVVNYWSGLLPSLQEAEDQDRFQVLSNIFIKQGSVPFSAVVTPDCPEFKSALDNVLMNLVEQQIWSELYAQWFPPALPPWSLEEMLAAPITPRPIAIVILDPDEFDIELGASMPVESLSGIGPVRGDRLRAAGVANLLQLAAFPAEEGAELLGVSAATFAAWRAEAREMMRRNG